MYYIPPNSLIKVLKINVLKGKNPLNQIRKEIQAHTTIKMAALHGRIYVQMHIVRFQQRAGAVTGILHNVT